MNFDAKCPICGAEFLTETNKGKINCPSCNAETDISRAIKYYSAFAENIEDRKEAHGEDYKTVNALLDGVGDLIKEEKYGEAEKLIGKALSLTSSDYRVYMAMVAVKTKNYTDLADVTHKEYINKAIDVADEEQKKHITALYKGYYEKTKLSGSQLKEVNAEESAVKRSRLEKGLKTLIPTFMAIDKRNKLFLIIFPLLLAIGVAVFSVFTFVVENIYLSFLGIALFSGGCALFRIRYSSNQKSRAFNSFLDLFDLLDGLSLPETALLGVYDKFYAIYLKFADNDPLFSISYDTVKFLELLLSVGEPKLTEFVESNEYFSENLPSSYYE